MCFSIFFTNFDWNISHSKKKLARYDQKCVFACKVKCSLFLSDFNETWIFLRDFRKILKYKILWKSGQCETELYNLDERKNKRTDMMKLIVAFGNFTNVSKTKEK